MKNNYNKRLYPNYLALTLINDGVKLRKNQKKAVCYFCNNKNIWGRKPYSTLYAHHVDENVSNDSKKNLISLCRKCHARLHHIYRLWKKTGGEKNGR